jgi:hypothetical protein
LPIEIHLADRARRAVPLPATNDQPRAANSAEWDLSPFTTHVIPEAKRSGTSKVKAGG